jgi:hypothetical protein
MSSEVDINRLRLPVKERPALVRRKPPRHKTGEKFLKGPIPMNWLTAAAKAPGKALHLAIGLWYWAGITRSREIRVSMKGLEQLGISRFSGYRGLTALENAGLISVERHRGRRPIVTLLDFPND